MNEIAERLERFADQTPFHDTKALMREAASALRGAVEVKALEWEQGKVNYRYKGAIYNGVEAKVVTGGRYIIDHIQHDPDAPPRGGAFGGAFAPYYSLQNSNWPLYKEYRGSHTTLDAAKVAAQADYNKRILSALKLSPAPAVVTEGMVERAAEIARDHLEIDGDDEAPFVRFDSIYDAVRAILESALSVQPQPVAADAKAEFDKLVEFFQGEGYGRFGYEGDVQGWSPAETAINAMRLLMNNAPAPQPVDAEVLAALKARIDFRLNEALCEMKPEHDDSITGFNEAWDIVTKVFALSRAKAVPAQGEAEPVAWQHRIYYDDTCKWSDWRDGRHDKLLANRFEERPLYASPVASSGWRPGPALRKIDEIRRQLAINVEIAKRDHPEGHLDGGKRVYIVPHSQETLASHITDRLNELVALLPTEGKEA